MSIIERLQEAKMLIQEADGAVSNLEEGRNTQIRWEHVKVGQGIRVKWTDYQIMVEEVPSKPLKSKYMRQMLFDFWYVRRSIGLSEFMMMNILQDAKLGSTSTYESAVSGIRKATAIARKRAIANGRYKGVTEEWFDKEVGEQTMLGHESEVYYLEVEPLDHKPIDAKGKDFVVKSTWHKFESYAPGSDLASHDPSYTKIVSKSDAAARKLYKMLKAKPNALVQVSFSKLGDWMKRNKIGFEYQFSVWR